MYIYIPIERMCSHSVFSDKWYVVYINLQHSRSPQVSTPISVHMCSTDSFSVNVVQCCVAWMDHSLVIPSELIVQVLYYSTILDKCSEHVLTRWIHHISQPWAGRCCYFHFAVLREAWHREGRRRIQDYTANKRPGQDVSLYTLVPESLLPTTML